MVGRAGKRYHYQGFYQLFVFSLLSFPAPTPAMALTITEIRTIYRNPVTRSIQGRFKATQEVYADASENVFNANTATKVVDDIIAENSERGLCDMSAGLLKTHLQHLKQFGADIDEAKYEKLIDALVAIQKKFLVGLDGRQTFLEGKVSILEGAVGKIQADVSKLSDRVGDLEKNQITEANVKKIVDEALVEQLDAMAQAHDEEMQHLRLEIARRDALPSGSKSRNRKPASRKPKARPTIGSNQQLWCRFRGTKERTRVMDVDEALDFLKQGHQVYFMVGRNPRNWMTPAEFKAYMEDLPDQADQAGPSTRK